MKRLVSAMTALALSASGALAADLGGPAYRSLKDGPVAEQEPASWTGFYAGIHGGYAFGDIDISQLPSLNDGDGFFAGIQAGANKQIGKWVIGIETDASWAGVKASKGLEAGFLTADIDSRLDYFGTVRGRIGHIWGPVLVYGTAGVAWGHVKTDVDITVAAPALALASSTSLGTDGSSWHVGYAVGGGLEAVVATNWTMKLEYLYIDLGKEKYAMTGDINGALSQDVNFHSVKLGLNYQF